ncbi:GyrI-like domain-containing protein [Candidatus Chlorohelix sp.]|uniref:GyrI-like domain-containing protein n=1 Tax=Candidatus Chlorohelix sp. TaxID=3139201 RepID=UPI0030327275
MPVLDFKKEMKELFNPSAKEAALVNVPPLPFLMIDGEGDPNTSAQFNAAVEALYSLSYTLKFALKKEPEPVEYSVAPLQGLWWMDDMSQFNMESKAGWKWTLMIMQPPQVTPAALERASTEAFKKKGLDTIRQVRLETYHEGLAAQIMHLGPYEAEPPTIQKLHQYIHAQGYQLRGKHHEIYLSDPRRTAAEKMKTIIRQPVGK